MRIQTGFFRLVLLVALAACETAGGFRRTMDGWVGAPVDDVIVRWGAPTATAPLRDGRTAYSWSRSARVSYGGVQSTNHCTVTLVADTAGRIVSWASTGNHCVAR